VPAPRVRARQRQIALGPDQHEIDDLYRAFARSLNRRRTAAELTQETLAHRCFLRTEQVSRLERGKTAPRFAELLLLARALGTEVGDLLDGLVAPTRDTSRQQMLALIASNADMNTVELAASLSLPRWYVNQNARYVRSIGES
jgi:transcriptional regulator with XRE-family HTH domain